MQNKTHPQLLKMSDLARQSGVPAATIKHYIREGLLPPPAARTGRSMAWYDPSSIPRIKAIKKLQGTRFLPLKVIKGLLDDQGPAAVAATEEAISAVLQRLAPAQSASRDKIIEAGMPAAELDWLGAIGLVSPIRDAAGEHYAGDDLVMLETLQAARDAGITREMLPPEILQSYLTAVQSLVRVELGLFRDSVLVHGGDQLARLTEAATVLSERLVVLLRRRLLLPTLRELVQQEGPQLPAKRARSRKRGAAR
ncbi:MAG: MerR family transcriptional regulator [Deltaproteobacteria bacterium]|nr:MerR family transcriptional regulator [Deltaproteobacteria bacterium]